MPEFSLATLATPDGPKAAVGVDSRFFVLGQVWPVLVELTCLDLLRSWDSAFPMLQDLVAHLDAGAIGGIASTDAQVLTPVQYPDKLIAVGANYSGHLKEMGLKVKKWASMPFFLRPPKTTLSGRARPS